MPLSRIEIRRRATAFAKEFADAHNEDGQAKTFWHEFFGVFGLKSNRIGSFELHVKKLNKADGYVDFFWPGKLLVEHKSLGKDLDKALAQANDYLHGLKDHELPRYLITSDFARIAVHDLETKQRTTIALAELPQRIELFDFISGWSAPRIVEEDPINREAAELMARLHDELKASGYEGHALEHYLVRLLFCLFADDTGIFERGVFYDFIEGHTREDGSDVGPRIAELFQLLNTPEDKRPKNLDDRWRDFHYINGKLFQEILPIATWDSAMRATLLEAAAKDWTNISPAIFGAMFQGVMDPKQRRDLGAHYTSEKNILKLIKPLFLDELWEEFNRVKGSKAHLEKFHQKLAGLKFLDPACGCGNFLVITYRELRRLELEVLKVKLKGQQVTNVQHFVNLDVDQFYGIEIEEFPAQIAQVALWLADHQMNMEVSNAFGDYMVRIPLRHSATIHHGNALRVDWQSLLTGTATPEGGHRVAPGSSLRNAGAAPTVNVTPEGGHREAVGPRLSGVSQMPSGSHGIGETPDGRDKRAPARPASGVTSSRNDQPRYDYILGNPPFVGSKLMTPEMREDIERVFSGVKGAGTLDFVCGWYALASQYMKTHGKHTTRTALVSTNSICQGEQVGILWGYLLSQGNKIHFAHQTFRWNNEAKGVAAVHCVIIGFGDTDVASKRIYQYDEPKAEPVEVTARNISPYLVEGSDHVLQSRGNPICMVPEIGIGNKPIDGGNYLFTTEERDAFIAIEPSSKKYFRRWLGSDEFINGWERWCLWLGEAAPAELKGMPEVLKRIEAVRKVRLESKSEPTRKLAATPTRFHVENMPTATYLIIPEVSSERRVFIPIGYVQPSTLASNLVKIVPNASLYHFGMLNSTMHNAWVRFTCGRLESRYRYSKDIVYNNYPWPENPTAAQKQAVEAAAQGVLDARANHKGASLADLYDPLTMPPDLVKAHQALDKAVDKCYRSQPFANDAKRVEYLFELYEKYTAGLLAQEKKSKRVRRS